MKLAGSWPVRPILRDGRAIAAAFSGGWLAPWRRMQGWANHRSLVVATPLAAPVLMTRIHLNGCVETKVSGAWLAGPARADAGAGGGADALVATHFKAVAEGLAGWPAIVALTRAVSWLAGTAMAGFTLYDLVTAGLKGALDSLLGWHVWLPAAFVVAGTCLRVGLRFWIRWTVHRAAH